MPPKLYRLFRLLWPGGLTNLKLLQALERNQWLTPAELRDMELKRMHQLVRSAWQNVPFYREYYQNLPFDPARLSSLEQFEQLPFLTKAHLNAHRERLLDPNYPQWKLTPNETGGSTGQPARFYNEYDYWRWNAAGENRARRWFGIQKGDRIAWIWGNPRDMPEWSLSNRFKAWLINERHLNAFSMTEEKMRNFAHMLLEWKPVLLKGYASSMELFAKFVEAEGITGIRPHYLETTSEKLYPHQRELLERVFQAPVSNVYGSREMGTIAQECPEYGRMHVFSDVRYVEVVANDRVVPPGEIGEIVNTNLIQFAFPFIRYKNGDLGIMDAEPCPCGRSLPVLKEILGRTNDYLVAADGQYVHSEFFAYTFRVKPEVEKFQVYQPERTALEIRLVTNQPVDTAWLNATHAEIQTRFGAQMKIDLQLVDDIGLTQAGKYRYIISDVKPDFVV